MEGSSFDVQYLGNTMLPKATTGLGAVQKPLKDLYFQFRKPGGEKHAKDMTLIVQRNGLVFEFSDTSGNQGKQAFYDIGLIHYIAALRFSATKGSDKKYKAAFLPIEDSKVPSNDKVYFQLDKKQATLVQSNHPVLLSLVMRRPTGVKSIECHSFIIRSSSDAIRLVSLIESLQTNEDPEYSSEVVQRDNKQYTPSGPADVIRTEYGEYEVYRGRKQLALTDEFFRPKDQGYPTSPSDQGPRSPGFGEPPRQHQPQQQYQQQPSYNQPNRMSTELRQSPDDPYQEYHRGPDARVSGEYREEAQMRARTSGEYREEAQMRARTSGEYREDVQIRPPHAQQQDKRTSSDLRNEKWKMPGLGQGEVAARTSAEGPFDRNAPQDNQRYSGVDVPVGRGRPGFGVDYPERADQGNRLSGGRADYGDQGNRLSGGRVDYGDYQGQNVGRSDYPDHRSDGRPDPQDNRGRVSSAYDEVYKQQMVEEQQRRLEEERKQNELEDKRYTQQIKTPDKDREPYAEIRRQKDANPKPTSPIVNEKRFSREPDIPSKPLSPRTEQPISPRGEFAPSGPGFSASNIESRPEVGRQRPVAKVPPHLVAGIKVLPTPPAAALKKPTSQREEYIKDNDYDNNLNILRKQRELREDYQKGNENPGQNYRDNNPRDPSRPMSDPDPHYGQDPYFRDQSNRYSAGDRLEQYSEHDGRVNPQYTHDRSGASDGPYSEVYKKEKEIASMFSNVKVSDQNPQFYTSGIHRK